MPIDNQELLKRGTPYQERPYLRSQLIAARERDVAESAKAEAARQADAVAERQRIAGVIKAGVDRGRPRQAAHSAPPDDRPEIAERMARPGVRHLLDRAVAGLLGDREGGK